jgi:hypothetical protein
MQRVINILLAFDCFVFALVTLGKSYPAESFSSAAYRADILGMYWGKARKPIDWLFKTVFRQDNHCERAYRSAVLNLPPDERSWPQN